MTRHISQSLNSAIELLEYDENWVRAGILDDALARSQLANFGLPDADTSTEHYRNAALNAFLANKATLTDVEFACLDKIAASELSKKLGDHVYHVLCKFEGLSDAQFDAVTKGYSSGPFDKLSFRRSLQRRIAANRKPSDVAAAAASDDTQLQAWLLHNGFAGPDHARLLAEKGSSKAVRNLAAELLRKLDRKS